MLIKVSETLYLGESAILSAEDNGHGGYTVEMVNGNKVTISDDALRRFLKHPGRKKEGNDGSDKQHG